MALWQTALKKIFPYALDFERFSESCNIVLKTRGLNPPNTLFANCTCRDEINQTDIKKWAVVWGENFDLSGLGGYPSAGITGLSAYSHHVPDQGYQLILYGPHVGINTEGYLGLVKRTGMHTDTSVCGALLSYQKKIFDDPAYLAKFDDLDPEQSLVEESLEPFKQQIIAAENPEKEITLCMYRIIDKQLGLLLRRLDSPIPTVLIGGIIVNTPVHHVDWIVPLRAIYQQKTGDSYQETDLLPQILAI